MEVRGVLLIATKQRLVVINLMKSENLDSTPTGGVVKVFNFVEKGFPFAASFFMRESKLYMVGGEETRPGLPEERLITSSTSNLDETSFASTGGLSRKIYVSSLTTTTDSITQFDEHSLKTLAPKANPIIEEIEGMIYLLAGPSYHYKEDFMPIPTFEVYDLSSHRFETLPTPPFYASHHKDPDYNIVRGHSVLGKTIYVFAGDEYYSYTIENRKWTCLGNSPDKVPVQEPLLPGNNGKFVPGYEDVVIYFSGDGELLALLLPPDDANGGSPLIQSLNEVYAKVQETIFWRGEGVIIAMGEERVMCFIRPEVLEIENDHILHRIHVTIFLLEKLNSSASNPHETDVQQSLDSPPIHDDNSVPFLSVTCLSQEFYNLDEWGLEVPQIRSAFFHPWSQVSRKQNG